MTVSAWLLASALLLSPAEAARGGLCPRKVVRRAGGELRLLDDQHAGGHGFVICGVNLERWGRNDYALVLDDQDRAIDVVVVTRRHEDDRGRVPWLEVQATVLAGHDVASDGLAARYWEPREDAGDAVQIGKTWGTILEVRGQGEDLRVRLNIGYAQGVRPTDRYRVYGPPRTTGHPNVDNQGMPYVGQLQVLEDPGNDANHVWARLQPEPGEDPALVAKRIRRGLLVREHGHAPRRPAREGETLLVLARWEAGVSGQAEAENLRLRLRDRLELMKGAGELPSNLRVELDQGPAPLGAEEARRLGEEWEAFAVLGGSLVLDGRRDAHLVPRWTESDPVYDGSEHLLLGTTQVDLHAVDRSLGEAPVLPAVAALLHRSMGRPEQAIRFYGQAVERLAGREENVGARTELRLLKFDEQWELGQSLELMAELDRWVQGEARGTWVEAYAETWRGFLLLAEGRFDDGLVSLDRAQEMVARTGGGRLLDGSEPGRMALAARMRRGATTGDIEAVDVLAEQARRAEWFDLEACARLFQCISLGNQESQELPVVRRQLSDALDRWSRSGLDPSLVALSGGELGCDWSPYTDVPTVELRATEPSILALDALWNTDAANRVAVLGEAVEAAWEAGDHELVLGLVINRALLQVRELDALDDAIETLVRLRSLDLPPEDLADLVYGLDMLGWALEQVGRAEEGLEVWEAALARVESADLSRAYSFDFSEASAVDAEEELGLEAVWDRTMGRQRGRYDVIRSQLRLRMAQTALRLGQAQKALDVAQAARKEARQLDTPELACKLDILAADAASRLGLGPEEERLLDDLEAWLGALPASAYRGDAWLTVAGYSVSQGEMARSLRASRRAVGDFLAAGATETYLGNAAYLAGNLRAAGLHQEALEELEVPLGIADVQTWPDARARLLAQKFFILSDLQRQQEAEHVLEELRAVAARATSHEVVSLMHVAESRNHFSRGAYDLALEETDAAIASFDSTWFQDQPGEVLNVMVDRLALLAEVADHDELMAAADEVFELEIQAGYWPQSLLVVADRLVADKRYLDLLEQSAKGLQAVQDARVELSPYVLGPGLYAMQRLPRTVLDKPVVMRGACAGGALLSQLSDVKRPDMGVPRFDFTIYCAPNLPPADIDLIRGATRAELLELYITALNALPTPPPGLTRCELRCWELQTWGEVRQDVSLEQCVPAFQPECEQYDPAWPVDYEYAEPLSPDSPAAE